MEQIDKKITDNLMGCIVCLSFADFMPINLDKYKNNHLELIAYRNKNNRFEFYVKIMTILDKREVYDFFIECNFTYIGKPHIMFCTVDQLIDKIGLVLRYMKRIMMYGS